MDGEDPGLYALDGEFWAMMTEQGYDFVDADGNITITDPGAGAASSSTTENSCLEATPDGSFHLQALLPVSPEDLDTTTDLTTVAQIGVALDGVTIFADAPSVADRGGLPALDACGGHIDPSGYYHWHFGAESIQTNLDEAGAEVTCGVEQDQEALVGFAFDGYGIYGPEEDGSVPSDLDECSGHVSDTEEFGERYHYHLTYDSPNLPSCRVGATATAKLTSPDNNAAALPDGEGGPGGGGPPPGGWMTPGAAVATARRSLLALLGVLVVSVAWTTPVAAHDSTSGSVVVELTDERVVVNASVPFAALGYEDTSGDGLISNDELRTQEAEIASTIVEDVRGNVVVTVDGEDLQIAGAGVPGLSEVGGEDAGSQNVALTFVTSPHDGDVGNVALEWAFDTPTPEVVLSHPGGVVVGELSDDQAVTFTLGTWAAMGSFFTLGIEHIRFGPDHLLFLLVLTLAVAGTTVDRSTAWRTVKLVTAFTIGHAISLCLAYLDLISIPVGLVEPAIALSIVAAAVLVMSGRADGAASVDRRVDRSGPRIGLRLQPLEPRARNLTASSGTRRVQHRYRRRADSGRADGSRRTLPRVEGTGRPHGLGPDPDSGLGGSGRAGLDSYPTDRGGRLNHCAYCADRARPGQLHDRCVRPLWWSRQPTGGLSHARNDGCSDSAQGVPEGETAMFGYTLGGYALHAPFEQDADAAAVWTGATVTRPRSSATTTTPTARRRTRLCSA